MEELRTELCSVSAGW